MSWTEVLAANVAIACIAGHVERGLQARKEAEDAKPRVHILHNGVPFGGYELCGNPWEWKRERDLWVPLADRKEATCDFCLEVWEAAQSEDPEST